MGTLKPHFGLSTKASGRYWLKHDLRYLIDSYLNETIIEEINLFKVSYIKRITTDFFAGKDYLYNRLWVLIVLHKWMKENQ